MAILTSKTYSFSPLNRGEGIATGEELRRLQSEYGFSPLNRGEGIATSSPECECGVVLEFQSPQSGRGHCNRISSMMTKFQSPSWGEESITHETD